MTAPFLRRHALLVSAYMHFAMKTNSSVASLSFPEKLRKKRDGAYSLIYMDTSLLHFAQNYMYKFLYNTYNLEKNNLFFRLRSI